MSAVAFILKQEGAIWLFSVCFPYVVLRNRFSSVALLVGFCGNDSWALFLRLVVAVWLCWVTNCCSVVALAVDFHDSVAYRCRFVFFLKKEPLRWLRPSDFLLSLPSQNLLNYGT